MGEIDINQTSKNVRSFLNGKFNRYLSWACLNLSDLLEMKKPVPDTDEVKSDNLKQMQKVINYSQLICYCVGKAFKDCPNQEKKPYRTILIEKYIHSKSISDLCHIIDYSSTRTTLLTRCALIEFALRFNTIQQQNKITPSINLVAYK